MTKKLKILKIFIAFLCGFSIFLSCIIINTKDLTVFADENMVVEETTQDDYILQNYHEPTKEENFENNKINVILKSDYYGEIGFENFYSNGYLSQIASITYNLETIYKGSDRKFTVMESENNPIFVLTLSTNKKEKVLSIINQLNEIDIVLVAEPNYIYETESDMVPVDTYYAEQWGLSGNYGIDAENAWDITTGSSEIKVGIFENGADLSHEDLSSHILSGNYSETTTNTHGTHVAGIIGAAKNNYGIAGISNATIYVLDRSDFVGSLEYASKNNIKVINASFHYTQNNSYANFDATHYAAIKNYDGLLVCSAGNDTLDIDFTPTYPASYDLPNVITVGSINKTGKKSSSSNYGDDSVDIFAPGNDILSTYPSSLCRAGTCDASSHYADGYHYMSGTSMAAPHVAGVAALMLSINNDLTGSQLKTIICESASYNSNLSGYCVTEGELNAYNSLYNVTQLPNISYTVYICNATYDTWDPIDVDDGVYHFTLNYGEERTVTALNFSGYNFECWVYYPTEISTKFDDPTILPVLSEDQTITIKNLSVENGDKLDVVACYTKKSSCITEGTLITLADGTQKAVECLTGDEMLLVWDMQTGSFASAPILFVDSDDESYYSVINLYFSDGTTVEIVDEHAFWNFDKNKYVYLREDAAQYIGDTFNKQSYDNEGDMTWESVELVDVVVSTEYTKVYSPVTYSYLCYYVNGLLSMPGATEGFANIFEVDPNTMTYDQNQFENDIMSYGLYTYDEFYEILPISENIFEAFSGKYLKVAVGKGLITIDEIVNLYENYIEYLN